MNSKFKDLKNKNIVITGGNGFLGKQLCDAFLSQGSKVLILDIKKSNSKKNLIQFKTDITKENELKKFLFFLKKKKIKIDVLINCAAKDYVPTKKKEKDEKLGLENFSEKLWAEDLNIGLKGSFLTTKILGSYMAKVKKNAVI
tara:strand:+ start:985 stop:1413 length:429 start_codon:yes stop_codon:yes gene_type:complete